MENISSSKIKIHLINKIDEFFKKVSLKFSLPLLFIQDANIHFFYENFDDSIDVKFPSTSLKLKLKLDQNNFLSV